MPWHFQLKSYYKSNAVVTTITVQFCIRVLTREKVKTRQRIRMVEEKNKLLIKTAKEGDMIEFPRGGLYSHWGVYVGNGQVIHYNKDSETPMEKSSVREDSLLDVAKNSEARVNNLNDHKIQPRNAEEIVKSARGQLGNKGYSLFGFNCEHFSNSCRYGIADSQQVNQLKKDTDKGIRKGLQWTIHDDML